MCLFLHLNMGLEEIDDDYARELKEAEQNFLKSITEKKNRSAAELNYKNSLNSARQSYNKKVSKHLKKIQANKNKKKQEKESLTAPFKVVPLNLNQSSYSRFKDKIKLAKFRLKFKLKNFIKNQTPDYLIFIRLKLRFKLKKFRLKTKEALHSFFIGIKNTLLVLLNSVGRFFKQLFALPFKSIGFVKKIFIRKSEKNPENKSSNSDQNK